MWSLSKAVLQARSREPLSQTPALSENYSFSGVCCNTTVRPLERERLQQDQVLSSTRYADNTKALPAVFPPELFLNDSVIYFFSFAHLSKEELAVPCVCCDKKLPVIFQPVPAGTEAGLEKVLTVGRVSPAGAVAPQPSLFLPGFPGVQLWEKPSRFCVTLVPILLWVGFCS